MKNYIIFKNLSVLVIFVMLFSSISLVLFSQETGAEKLNLKEKTLLPYIYRNVKVSEDDYEEKFSMGIHYMGEIYDWDANLDLRTVEIIVYSEIKEILDKLSKWGGNYKMTCEGVFYTPTKNPCNVTELFFSTPRSSITGFDNSEDYVYIQGYETYNTHTVTINAPRDKQDQEIVPGYYAFKVHFHSEYGFGGFTNFGALIGGPSSRDFYLSYGYRLNELEDSPGDDDDDSVDDDDDIPPSDNDEDDDVIKVRTFNSKLLSCFPIVQKLLRRIMSFKSTLFFI